MYSDETPRVRDAVPARPAAVRRHRPRPRARPPPRTSGASNPSRSTTRVDYRELVENKEREREARSRPKARRRPTTTHDVRSPGRRMKQPQRIASPSSPAPAAASVGPPPSSSPPRVHARPRRRRRRRARRHPAAVEDRRRARRSVHVADVSDADRMAELPDEVLAQHGACHILVNNAGVLTVGRFADDTLDDIRWIVGINVFGVVHGCHYFLPVLARGRRSPHRERVEHGRLRRHPPERRLLAHQGRRSARSPRRSAPSSSAPRSASAPCSPGRRHQHHGPRPRRPGRTPRRLRQDRSRRTCAAHPRPPPARSCAPSSTTSPASCSDPTPAPIDLVARILPGPHRPHRPRPQPDHQIGAATCCESCNGPPATSAGRPRQQSTSSGRRSPPAPAAIRLRPLTVAVHGKVYSVDLGPEPHPTGGTR